MRTRKRRERDVVRGREGERYERDKQKERERRELERQTDGHSIDGGPTTPRQYSIPVTANSHSKRSQHTVTEHRTQSHRHSIKGGADRPPPTPETGEIVGGEKGAHE